MRFAKDYIGADYHNEGHSHIDAFSHVAYDGLFYDGKPEQSVTAQGAESGAIDILRDGLVGRGVLLDMPRAARGPVAGAGGARVLEDLEAAEREQGVRVGPGDILLVRTGHARRRAELPPWDTRKAKAGLHPTTAPFLAERCVAALGSDGNNDTAPSTTEGVGFPIHVLALNAMGIHLLDYLQFEDLVRQCEARAALGVPVRRRAAAARARDRVAAQPDRGLLSARCSTSGSTVVPARWRRSVRGSTRAARRGTWRSRPACAPGHALLTAEVRPESADAVLDFLHEPRGARRRTSRSRGSTRSGRSLRAAQHEPDLGRRARDRPGGTLGRWRATSSS